MIFLFIVHRSSLIPLHLLWWDTAYDTVVIPSNQHYSPPPGIQMPDRLTCGERVNTFCGTARHAAEEETP